MKFGGVSLTVETPVHLPNPPQPGGFKHHQSNETEYSKWTTLSTYEDKRLSAMSK